ncbi:MAG: prolipoprotein diacylglyceryl transferase, partial [Armatimonadetes bacterium]|nr:prolipoprotein diacylglyceryl transferase [Candidatus Hippobium faecium]
MYPVLFSIGRFSVHAYGFFLAVGFVFGLLRVYYIAPKYNLDKDKVVDLCVYILLAGIVGSRLLYVLANLDKYTLKEAFAIWNGGLSFHGGIIVGIAVGIIYAKVRKLNFWTVLDILSPSVCIGYGFTRIGCFLNGCCFGIESSMPWAVKMSTPEGVCLCEPVQLYACAVSFLMFFILTKFEFKQKKPGYVFVWYLIFYGIYRFFIEFLRHHIAEDYIIFNISGGQVLS